MVGIKFGREYNSDSTDIEIQKAFVGKQKRSQ